MNIAPGQIWRQNYGFYYTVISVTPNQVKVMNGNVEWVTDVKEFLEEFTYSHDSPEVSEVELVDGYIYRIKGANPNEWLVMRGQNGDGTLKNSIYLSGSLHTGIPARLAKDVALCFTKAAEDLENETKEVCQEG